MGKGSIVQGQGSFPIHTHIAGSRQIGPPTTGPSPAQSTPGRIVHIFWAESWPRTIVTHTNTSSDRELLIQR